MTRSDLVIGIETDQLAERAADEHRNPNKRNVVAVVVTHHPDAEFPERLSALESQFGRVIVIDNHSCDDVLASVRDLSKGNSTIELIANPQNLGVAAAINQGCRRAAECGADWVVTFDQDSQPEADFLSCQAADWTKDLQRDRIGLVGVNFRGPTGTTVLSPGSGLADARAVITSGSLLKLAAWQDVGPFREDFFIDEVDHEYALRLRRRGWLVKVNRRVLMEHAIGSPSPHRLGVWRPVLSHHSGLRRYYMVRNRILMARAHLRFDPRFVCGQLLRSIRECASVLLFEPQKAAKLRAMAQGLVDGIRGRTGPAAWYRP